MRQPPNEDEWAPPPAAPQRSPVEEPAATVPAPALAGAWEGSSQLRSACRVLLAGNAVGWSAFWLHTLYFMNGRFYGSNAPLYLQAASVLLTVIALVIGLYLRTSRLQLLAIGVASAIAGAGTIAAGCMLVFHLAYSLIAPSHSLLVTTLAFAGSALGVAASVLLTRSCVRTIWQRTVQETRGAHNWDNAGLAAQKSKVPLVEKRQVWWRILTILPLAIVGLLLLFSMTMVLIFESRRGSDWIPAAAVMGLTVFYLQGLYSPAWVTRFLSIGASVGLGLYILTWLPGQLWQWYSFSFGRVEFLAVLLQLVILAISAGCPLGAYHYTGGELVRLAAKAREYALRQPEEDTGLDAGSWDEAKPKG